MLEKKHILEIANTAMPFGKYKGRMLVDLPEAYLIWFARQGFPDNHLGRLLETTLALKTEGLDAVIRPLTRKDS